MEFNVIHILKHLVLLILVTVLMCFKVEGQCNTNTSICDNNSLAGPFSFAPASNNPSSCLDFLSGSGANDYAYIILYITQGGQLNLLVNGNNTSGFIDVAVFDITGQTDPCASLSPNTELACNYADFSNGCAQFGSVFNCNSIVSAPNVNTGDVIMILVEDYNSIHSSFTLSLGNTAGSAQTGPPDATITPVPPFCPGAPPVQLNAANNGGVWSGPGVSPTGFFDPNAAGPGVHTINYSIGQAPCNSSSSTTITVSPTITPTFNPVGPFCQGAAIPALPTSSLDSPPITGSWSPAINNTATTTYTFNPSPGQCATTTNLTIEILPSPPPPATACYETANFNGATCSWEVTGAQPPQPTTACYETANFNTGTCAWEVTGTQPPPPATACYETASFNNTTCSWEVTGTQPPPPTTACYETANFNTGTCAWEVTGTQPPPPTTACYETANFNNATCSWEVTGAQPPQPTTACYETANFNTGTCAWEVTGTQPPPPTTACYETANFNTGTCAWEVTGIQPPPPATACYETANFNTGTCAWEVTGTQPPPPTTACYETANFNTGTCAWEVTGTQPPPPTTACYETANFNNTTCSWEVTGVQPPAPATACYETANFNTGTCAWEVTGTQPPMPTLNCYEDATFNTTSCSWDVFSLLLPSYTIMGTDPSACGISDGEILISGLIPGETYTVSYNGGTSQSFTANAAGEIIISGLAQGVYTNFEITENGCTITENVVINLTEPNAPVVDAGAPQTVCEGDQLNLTAINPDGANISWDQGVQDGVGFTPPVGTTTYTVIAELNNCVSTDQVTITVNPNPTIEAGAPQTVCEGDQITLTATNPDGANISWDQGVQDGVSFTPPLGTTTYTVTAELLGCTSTDEVLVTVNPNPTFTVSGANPTECGVADGVITISGLSPGGTFTVTYNGGAAQTYTANANGEVTITGLSQGTYTDFSVTQNGCTTTETVVITLVDPNPPTVDAGAPQTVCEGDQLNLTAINPDGANISWDQGVQDGVGFTPPVGTTTYTVTAELNNCVSTDQVTITVNPNPTIEAGAPQTVCEGDQITLTATNPDGANISWDQGVQDGVSFTPPLGTTTYTVTAELQGCISTDEVEVTVNPNPTFTVSGANPTECGVADGVITISGLSPGGTFTVTYNGGAAQAYTANTNGEVTITGLSQGTYTDFSVTQNGCTVTDNVVINLSEPSAPTVSAGIPQSVCIGDQVTLIANNPDGANITWNQGVTNGVPFTPALGTTTYTVTAELNNCVSIDQVTVTVHALPNVNAGPDMVICLGDEVTLNASGADTYFWGPTIVNGMPFAPQGSGSFVVVGTDQSTGCQNTDTLFIQVNPTIPVFFDVDNNVGCVPTEITFFNQSPGNPVMCEWQIGGATVNSCSDFVFNFNNSGCHNVTLTLTTVDGCVSSHTETNFVCIDNDPIADFIVDPIEISTIDPTANFVNESVGATNYLWDFGDMMGSSTEEHPSYTYNPDSPGTYNVQLIAISENGCRDTTVKAIRIREAVIFYVPNAFTPDNNGVNEVFQPVFTSGFDPYNYHLTIFNRWGEIIFESFNAAVGWNGTYGGNVVKDGTYIWKIEFRELETDRRITRQGHVTVIR